MCVFFLFYSLVFFSLFFGNKNENKKLKERALQIKIEKKER